MSYINVFLFYTDQVDNVIHIIIYLVKRTLRKKAQEKKIYKSPLHF